MIQINVHFNLQTQRMILAMYLAMSRTTLSRWWQRVSVSFTCELLSYSLKCVLVIFLLIALVHSVQMIKFRTWWMIAMVIGLYSKRKTTRANSSANRSAITSLRNWFRDTVRPPFTSAISGPLQGRVPLDCAFGMCPISLRSPTYLYHLHSPLALCFHCFRLRYTGTSRSVR